MCLNNGLTNLLLYIASGNPGAASVLGQLQHFPGNRDHLFRWLADNGIIGPTLWVAYKEMCHGDIATLLMWIDEQIRNPSPKYEIQQYEGLCGGCGKNTYIAAIIPDFTDYHCYQCRKKFKELI